jgi:hypothetical protein
MMRLLLALALAAIAAPAFAELDGPFVVRDLSACATAGSPPVTTCSQAPGLHYIVTAAFYSAHADVLAPYRDAVQANLQNVYAGDDPAAPTYTVALTFPDSATLAAVRNELGLR